MILCVGICSYEGKGGMCFICFSEFFLKLRLRKDFVEIFLYEMIYVYLFVINNDKDWEGYGLEFCKYMYCINSLIGVNIMVYYIFYDEVDEYWWYWWCCDGLC